MQVTKHQLENLYVGHGLTQRQCAEALGLPTYGSVKWLMKKYGIAARPQLQVNKWHGGARRREINKKAITCSQCGKQIMRFPSQIHEQNFCNRKCWHDWRHRDLSGQRIGMLLVIRKAGRDDHNHRLWECRCDCGNTKTYNTSALAVVTGCGCQRNPSGEKNPRWKGGKKEFACDYCGKPIHKWMSERTHEFKFCGNECRHKHYAGRMSGENNPKWKPLVNTTCAFCGESLAVYESRKKNYEKLFCGRECLAKWRSINGIGRANPNWKGGKSFEPYPTTWNFKLREAIRDRDGRVCQACGISENGERLAVHHIDYDKKNIVPDNLVALCHHCHSKTNSDREQWKHYFLTRMIVPKTGTDD